MQTSRFQHLIKRFRDHTDRIFKKHGMKASGYWIPAEGSAKTKRTIVYFLEHPSRYEAYRNWNNFSNDKEWEKVMDQPEFQGLLSEKPTNFFLTANDYSFLASNEIAKPGGIFELHPHVRTREN